MSARAPLGLLLGGLVAGCSGAIGVQQDAIVGGTPTNAWPEVAALRIEGAFHCSGVLVGPRLLATAGHCVYGYEFDPAPFDVAFGPDANAPDATTAVEALVAHPEHGTNPSYDIGVVILAEDAPVAPVPWNEVELDDAALGLTLVGYGDTSVDDPGTERLRREVDVDLAELTSTALRWNHDDKGTCHGDSGGGAYADLGGGPVLVGIHSEGAADCVGWGSAVRTDVFADFLANPEVAGDDDDATLPAGDDDDSALPGDGGCDCGGGGGAQTLALVLFVGLTPWRRRRR